MSDLKLASERDENEIAASNAAARLNYATRCLAANILRIVAGAGKAHQLIPQMIEVFNCYETMREFVGSAAFPYVPYGPMVDGLHSLDWRKDNPLYSAPSEADLARWERDGTAEVQRAEARVIKAALRVVAAQLLAQPTQESTAENDLVFAIMDREKARKDSNARNNVYGVP
jgi:hypothetical protein